MPLLISGGTGSGGSGLAVRKDHNFNNLTARDAYFPTKLNELTKDLTYVWTNDDNKLYRWIGESNPSSYDSSKFKEVTPVIKGEQGIQGNQGIQGEKGEQGIQGEKGNIPNHSWENTSLRFELPNGLWGNYVDLKGEQGIQGKQGDKGDKPKHEWSDNDIRFENPDGTWGDYVTLKGNEGDSAYDVYVSNTLPNQPLNKSDWLKSLEGDGFKLKGLYDQLAIYKNLDVVSYANKMWACSLTSEENVNGIQNITPTTENKQWMLLLEVVVDSSNIIRDDLLKSNAHTYSVDKINNELNKKSNKDEVLVKGSNIAYEATLDGEPICLKQLKDSDYKIILDRIPDTDNYVKTENNFDDAMKSKLIAMQDSNKGFFGSVALLQEKHPNGTELNENLRVGDFAIVGGDGGGTYWYYSNELIWVDTGNKNGSGLSLDIYDPRSIRKDIFDMDSMTESENRKILTKDERLKLESVDSNKVDGIPVDSKSRKDKTVLYYDNELGQYSHSELIDGKMIASYTGDNIKRIDMISDPNYNIKPAYIYLDSITEQIYRWHRPSLAFFEYRSQKIGTGRFPLNPINGQEYIGLETIYAWSEDDKAWLIKSTKIENQSVIRTSWPEYLEWVRENPNGTGVFYIVNAGKIIDYYNGVGVESPNGRGNDGSMRPFVNTDKNKLFVDTIKKIAYKYNTLFNYWEVMINGYIEGFLDMQPTSNGIIRYDFNTIDNSDDKETWSIQYDSQNNKIVSWLTSTRVWQHIKVLWNTVNDNENIQKKYGFIQAQTLSLPEITNDGVESEVEFTCQKSKFTGMSFGYRFIKYGNNMFITDKWMVDFERQNSYPLNCSFTNLGERLSNTITPPEHLREYWDIGLKQMLIINNKGVWRSFDQKFEDISFPENPTDGQTFISAMGDKYIWTDSSRYWRLDIVSNNKFEDKINISKINTPTTLNDGDFYYNGDLMFRKGTENINLTSKDESAQCMATYYFSYNDFTIPIYVTNGKWKFGSALKSVTSIIQNEGSSVNNPIFLGDSKWRLPKGVWSFRYWMSNNDCPDGNLDWDINFNIVKNQTTLNSFRLSKSTSIGNFDFGTTGEVTVRSNGTDTIGFAGINFYLYSNGNPNGLYVQFEKLI